MKNPLSLEAFLDWVEKQPANGEYDFSDPHTCALAQYADILGVDQVQWFDASVNSESFWAKADILAGAFGRPYTFGALASRLRASLKAS